MGLVNSVVPLADLERETVALCREMLALSPFALRLRQGRLQRPRGRLRGDPAARPRRQPPLLRQRRGPRGPRGVQGESQPGLREVPQAPMRIWLMAARPRTLPAAIAPVLVGTAAAVYVSGGLPRVGGFLAALVGSVFIQIGTNLANDYSDARRGADTADRLGPVRVTSSGLVAPQRVLVATWVAFAVAVACGIYLAALAGPVILADRRPLDRRRRPLHRRAAALWLRRARRGLRLPLLRPRRRQRLLLRPGRADRLRCRSGFRWPSGCSPPRSSSSTTSATSRPTGGPASVTLAVRLGRARTRRLYAGLVDGAYVVLLVTLLIKGGPWWALLGLLSIPLLGRPMRAVQTRTDGACAQRGAGRHRGPAGGVQRSRLGRASDRELAMAIASVEVVPYALPFKRALRDGARGRSSGARWSCCGSATRTASWDWARPFRSRCAAARRWKRWWRSSKRGPSGHARAVTPWEPAQMSPPALCAVRTALVDLAARHAGAPLPSSRRRASAQPVQCNATLTAGEPARWPAGLAWAEDGFRTFKLKVGVAEDRSSSGWCERRSGRRRSFVSTRTPPGRSTRLPRTWPRSSPTTSSSSSSRWRRWRRWWRCGRGPTSRSPLTRASRRSATRSAPT